MTDPFDGFLLGKRYLLHDRDTKFTQAFDGLLKASGVEPVLLPPRSPNLNAYCERFVRSIKAGGFQSSSDKSSSWFPLTQNFAKSAMVRSTISLDFETMMDLRLKRPNQ